MDRRRGAAFTLIELLVVMIIIAIIIAITLPALRSIRATTRKSATEAMLRQITNAAAVFQTDNRRLPGYFTAKQMGSSTNEQAGFVEMQNVLLDLAGFQDGTTLVGPDPNAPPPGNGLVRLDVNSLGISGQGNTKAYWVPDGKHLQAQAETGQQEVSGHPPNATLPTVVDHFRNPILAWVVDDSTGGAIKTVDEFAQVSSSSPARFYWNSNAGFLRATAFGRSATDQKSGSYLGEDVAQWREESLAGVLGDPNWPYKDPMNATNMPHEVPSKPRAPFMVHSAGQDGLFVGKKDGAAQMANGYVDYRVNFAPDVTQPIGAGNTWTDKDDKATNIDLMSRFFDDVLVGGGN